MSELARAEIEVEVRYAETDAMGIVHHSNYLVWFELARTDLCRQSGYEYAEIDRGGHRLTVTGVQLRYRRPARYGEHVQVTATIARLGSRGIRFAYDVRAGDSALASGTTEHVWIDQEGRPCRMPAYLEEPFRRLAGI